MKVLIILLIELFLCSCGTQHMVGPNASTDQQKNAFIRMVSGNKKGFFGDYYFLIGSYEKNNYQIIITHIDDVQTPWNPRPNGEIEVGAGPHTLKADVHYGNFALGWGEVYVNRCKSTFTFTAKAGEKYGFSLSPIKDPPTLSVININAALSIMDVPCEIEKINIEQKSPLQ